MGKCRKLSQQKGFTLLELLIVVAIIGILAAIAIPAMSSYAKKAHYAAALAECREVYTAFTGYHIDNGMYPYDSSNPKFDLATFFPLDYSGAITQRLVGQKADDFKSPDDGGLNQEFWLQMTLAEDPSVQFLIAHSDDAALEPGVWLRGVYVYRNGVRVQ